MKEFILKVKKILEDNNVTYWLDTGNLLEAYRGDIIEHNFTDADFGAFIEDWQTIKTLFSNHAEIGFKRIWRGEIAIYNKLNPKEHLDFFLYTFKGEKGWLHDYVPHSITGHYDLERGLIHDKAKIFPLKTINYLGQVFPCPNDIEHHLKIRYGDWRNPNSKWTYQEAENQDINYRQIAVIIPSFFRWDKTKALIESLLKTYPERYLRLYIGEQSPAYYWSNENFKKERDELIKILSAKGHKFFQFSENIGLSYVRNKLIEMSTEPLIMIIDNDFLFDTSVNLNILTEILLTNKDIGIVAGQLKNYNHKKIFSYNFDLNLNPIQKIKRVKSIMTSVQSKTQTGYKFTYNDLVLNCFLAKREVFDDVKYDEKFKLVEHLDFFLRLKRDTNWKTCFTNQVSVNHNNTPNSDRYMKFRNGKYGINVINGRNYFEKKWGIALKDVPIIGENNV